MLKPSIQTITVKYLINFLLVLAICLLLITGLNFRALSKDAIENQALAHADLVKSGLTAHMKGGIMDKRDYYLQEIRQLHQINRLHVIRGQGVTDQFGAGQGLEKTVDAVALKAFASGRPVFVLDEWRSRPTIRAIIPYVAESEGSLNCLTCHKVEAGTVLGAVDLELDVTAYRNRALLVLGGIMSISLVFLVLILLNTSRTIQQHVTRPLEALIEKARRAYHQQEPLNRDAFATREFAHVADEFNLFNQEVIAHQELLQQKNRELVALNHEIESTVRETVYTMGVIEEQRSKETNSHTKRVSEYCRLLATKLGLPENDIDLVATAAPLHDIGKLGIPDEILLKPGSLTEDERRIMANHTRIGHAMLRHSQRDILVAGGIIALQHHEKWDGSGYPQGLRGEDIHVYGRIVALADVFDALISERIYKKSWNVQEVIDWIGAQRGRHFDPRLVDIFLRDASEFLAIFERYPTSGSGEISVSGQP